MEILEGILDPFCEALDTIRKLKAEAAEKDEIDITKTKKEKDEKTKIIPGTVAADPELVDRLNEEFSWEFQVQKSGKQASIKCDLKSQEVIFNGAPVCKLFLFFKIEMPIQDLLTIVPVKTKHLKFIWKARKEDKITFSNRTSRQQFIELYWFLMNGLSRVFSTMVLLN